MLDPRKAIALSSGLVISLVIARGYYSLTTGYILPDEAFYQNLFLLNGGLGFSSYRPFFHLVYDLFFYGTNSLQSLILRGALFESVWALGCIFIFYKLLKELGISEKGRSWSVLMLPFFPVFSVMAVFFVTETVALFLVLVGLFFATRYFNSGSLKSIGLSALFFVFAAQTREPYMVLLLGIPLFLLLKRSWKGLIVYAPIASIAAPIPTRLSPLAIDTPIQRFLFDYLPASLPRFTEEVVSKISGSKGGGVVSGGNPGPGTTGGVVQGSVSIPSYVFFAQNHVGLVANPQVGLAFFEGLAFGFGPLLFLVAASLFLVRNRLVSFVSVASFIAYLIVVDFSVIFLPDATALWSSNIFRLSSAALPSAICLGWLFSRPKIWKPVGVCFIAGLFFLLPLPSVLQSSQNLSGGANRLTLDYRAPYYLMSQYAAPGSLIITNVGIPQMQTFANFDRNVTVVGLPFNMANFTILVNQGWTHVYLYDSWVSLSDPSFFTLCQCYPSYYVGILYSHSVDGYKVVPVFENGESYALELIR